MRLDARGRPRIPPVAKLVDASAEIAGELRDRDAARG